MPDHPPVEASEFDACRDASLDASQDRAAVATSSSNAGHLVYDPHTLDELEGIFGRPRLMDLLGRLKLEIAQCLHASSDQRDILGRDAHTLLSVSGSLGFVGLSQRCSEIEQAYLLGADLAAPLEAARRAAETAMAVIEALEAAGPGAG